MDFLDTFSPVAKLVTVKVLLTLATFSKWHLVQVDVNNAFLSGGLFEDIYMDLPLGYNKSRSLTKSDRKLVYHPYMALNRLPDNGSPNHLRPYINIVLLSRSLIIPSSRKVQVPPLWPF